MPTDSADLVLLAHVVETSEEVPTLLREVWRILKPEGRVIVIVPNRRGVWARLETTPFGHGRPYTRGQLERLLARSMYEPTAWSTALFFPPLHNALLLRGALAWERLGSMAWPAFAGVNIVEARKSVGAPLVIPVKKAALIPGLGPAAVPVRAPARTPARA
ncbi:MAG: methyltransferase domain-containing protein [Pseudomonadota bacterium]